MNLNPAIKELNEQAKVYFSAKQYDHSIESCEKALEIMDNAETRFVMVEPLIMIDKYEEARNCAEKALILEPENGEGYFHLGNISLLEGKYEDGKQDYARAIKLGFKETQIFINLAAVEEEKGNFTGAIEYYKKAIAVDTSLAFPQMRTIELLRDMGKLSDALEAADKMIENLPEIFEGHHYKILLLLEMRKLTEAGEAVGYALDMFPDDEGFLFDKVRLMEERGEYEDALSLLEELKTLPEDIFATEKARLLINLEKTDEAEGILKSIKDSNNNFASFMLIVLALEQKEWDSVIKCSEEIIKNSDKDIYYYSALYYKAAAEKQSGKGTGSFATTQKLLQEACSENAGLLDLYAFRALCYKEIGELDKALDMVNYILNLEPQAGEAYMIRAMIYKAKGDDVRAASDEKTAKEKSPLLSSVKLDSGE